MDRLVIWRLRNSLLRSSAGIKWYSWQHVAMGMILLLAAALSFFRLDQLGYGNVYYAAAVKSMLQSWHNYFFVSFDSANFVSVDKPPIGLWVQTASAKLFGFTGWNLLWPQALAGVFSVAVLYMLVRRSFGPLAGVIAALALALTPINVVTNRNNTADSLLVLTVLLATWTICRAMESGRLRWLLLCAVLMGIGFNIKALQAYLVLPAFGLAYMLGIAGHWQVRCLRLGVAFLLLLIVSLSWIIAVDLVPAANRPYVGSSQTNSELELAIGYNGLIRLLGIGGSQSASASHADTSSASLGTLISTFIASDETGSPGPLRLFNQQLGSQIGWLLPLALIGLLVACWQTKIRFPLNQKRRALLLWGTWLLTVGAFFSVAGFFHTYYLVMLAPAVCALVGIGVASLLQEYLRTDWRSWLFPCALLITGGIQVLLLAPYPAYSRFLLPAIIGLSALAVLLLSLVTCVIRLRVPVMLTCGVSLGLLALFVSPLLWSTLSVLHAGDMLIPRAGPALASSQVATSAANYAYDEERQRLIQYLLLHEGKTRFLLATLDSLTAAPIILATDKPVMALGGFLGIDPIVTPEKLSVLVAGGEVRYFLLPYFQVSQLPVQIRQALAQKDFARFGIASSLVALLSWVNTNCQLVPDELWRVQSEQASTTNQGQFSFGGVSEKLYSCAKHHRR
ncbi:MAG TPA: glycosyltransferase family 39 protein [Ktedonobacteraceae bacterium]|nr:glycosyltransferase family 39 protein [Ktedonobacteraceae bacterium]